MFFEEGLKPNFFGSACFVKLDHFFYRNLFHKNVEFLNDLEDRVFLRRFSISERSSDLQFFSHNAKERLQRVNHKGDIHHLGYIKRLVLNFVEN